jgi:Kef-type K+ transport system membrane component KefB
MPSSIDSAALQPFLQVLAYSIIFLIGGAIAGKYFVQMKIDKAKLDNKTFLYALAFLFLYAYIAEFIGLSSIVGAFLAGMLLAQSRHAGEIDSRSLSIELIFTPIFFISLGMLVDVPSLAQFFWPIMVLSILAILTKFIGCGAGALLSKLSRHDSTLVGVGMAPRGEVALIIAVFGLSAGILTSSEYSIICAMAFLTTIAMPPVLNHLLKNKISKGGAPA